jgi:hypothetical protein
MQLNTGSGKAMSLYVLRVAGSFISERERSARVPNRGCVLRHDMFSSAAGPWRKMVQMAQVEAYQQANRDHDFVWQIVFEFVLKICLSLSR